MLAKYSPQRVELLDIAGRRAGAVRVDVVDGIRVDSFSDEGAFIFAGRARAGYRPDDRASRAWFYAMRALAHPFALADCKAEQLQVGVAHGYDVLATPRDEFGVRTLYLVERKTGRLGQVRFEEEENKPFATVQYENYAHVDGIHLPRQIIVELRLRTEDEEKRTWKENRFTFKERVDEWTVNPETLPDLAPPHPPATLPQGFKRSVHKTVADPYDLTVADLDRDGRSDIAVAGAGGIAVHFGGAFEEPVRVPLGEGSHRGCRVADLDLDGVPELVVMSWTRPSDSYFIVSFDGKRSPKVRKMFAAPHFGYALRLGLLRQITSSPPQTGCGALSLLALFLFLLLAFLGLVLGSRDRGTLQRHRLSHCA